MKQPAVLIFLLLFSQPDVLAARPAPAADSLATARRFSSMEAALQTNRRQLDSLKLHVRKLESAAVRAQLNAGEWTLVFSPLVLFVGTLLLLRRKLSGFRIRELLLESELPRRTIANPQYTVANLSALATTTPGMDLARVLPPTLEISEPHFSKSSSRYMAFITSCLAWVITLLLTCFFIYEYIVTDRAPDLGGFASVLISLGVGVAPYAFNKAASALR